MVWDINLLENLRIKSPIWFHKSLFNRLGILVVVFTIILTAVLYYQFEYFFTTQDSILDSHEQYYYSKMVERWGDPPDSALVEIEVQNLQMWCGIFIREIDTVQIYIPSIKAYVDSIVSVPGKQYWSNLPGNINTEEFIRWVISTDYEEMYNIDIPYKTFTGEIDTYPSTVVDNGKYIFYMIIDYIPPSDWYNVIFAILLAIIFILGLYFFIRRYLKPVELMKNRIIALEHGDLQSKVKIIGEDELAELSQSMNKMIAEINSLLENKHQLLLEVSHELRSPLARMQFLIEMLPVHKNNLKLREEINFLERMIENLLLSDRLSMPYSTLDLKNIKTSEIIEKIKNLFPNQQEQINIHNSIPNEEIEIDETKFIIALRNLVDNAIKYSENKDIDLSIEKNDSFKFHVKDIGIGITDENINKITQPFFQANQTVTTQGFGLGLTISKKIIESHQGWMSIQSKKGLGSVFTLHLPT